MLSGSALAQDPAAPAPAAPALTQAEQAPLRGMPLLRRYTAEDYAAAPLHFDVEADADGSVYIGNVEGVLRFDGSQWARLELPGRAPARALARGADGRLYVGGYDHFGVIEASRGGERQYHDLRGVFGLRGEDAHLGNIWSVVATSGGVYFQAERRLYFLGYDGGTAHWPLDPQVRSLRGLGDALYARVEGLGLARFDAGRMERVAGGERFASQPLYGLFEHPDGLLLVGADGFHLAGPAGIRPVRGEAGRIFARHMPYTSLRLSDGSIAIGTSDGQVLRFDQQLRFLERWPLGAYGVLSLGLDREGGLWAATEGDLVRLRVPSPWSVFTAADGLQGTLWDCVWHDGTLWVATSVGVDRGHPDGSGRTVFRQAVRTELETYDLEADPAGLLIGERAGVLWLPLGATTPVRVVQMESAYWLLRSPFDPDTVFALGDLALVRLQRVAGGYQPVARWSLEGLSPTAIQLTAADTIWLADSRGPPQRWTLSDDGREVLSREPFGAERGVDVDASFGSTLVRLDGRLIAISGDSAFRFEDDRFVPDTAGLLQRFERPMELGVAETPVGTFAWTSRQLLQRLPTGGEWQPVQLGSRLARGFSNLHADADGRIRVITWSGLLQLDPGAPEAPHPALAVLLRQVEARPPGGEPRLLPVDGQAPEPLPAGTQLRLALQLPTMEPGAEVRWRIAGLAGEWSDWAPVAESTITVRSLDGGEYLLEAEGRTPSGRSVEPLAWRFSATPHWWSTAPAIAVAGLLIASLLLLGSQLIARLRYRQFVAINQRLEARIAERTRALEDANRKLEELATEDSLTGVANRRALELALQREWERSAELGVPLAVVMVDVDHFKQFNDRHGHLEGDQRLRAVAQRLAAQSRPPRELLARFGGEEFALVLPTHGIDEAMDRAERLRRLFDDGQDDGLTVSIGVAVAVPQPDGTPSDLLRSADAALYRAKRNGRNRVELARD